MWVLTHWEGSSEQIPFQGNCAEEYACFHDRWQSVYQALTASEIFLRMARCQLWLYIDVDTCAQVCDPPCAWAISKC